MEINTGNRKIPNANSFREKTSAFIVSMNEFIKDTCNDDLVPSIDLYNIFASPDQEDLLNPEFAIGDNAHLNIFGQKRLAEAFYEGFLKDSEEPGTVVCLGDSHTQGFPIREADRNGIPIDPETDDPHQYPYWLAKRMDAVFINRGIAGNTLYGMNNRFREEVLPHFPDHCLIQGGTNDSLLGTPLEESKNDIRELIERCLSAEIIPVVGTILPLGF